MDVVPVVDVEEVVPVVVGFSDEELSFLHAKNVTDARQINSNVLVNVFILFVVFLYNKDDYTNPYKVRIDATLGKNYHRLDIV